ncbi:hypothetical protein UPYG_G00353090 [Umbra pygmaea]|uniref:Uncharacterized protein n=1 Tax=Umbra pygmaea TaxID=75934 RepID=A0ABD0VWE0_UMBPY
MTFDLLENERVTDEMSAASGLQFKRMKGEFLPPPEKVGELMETEKNDAPALEISLPPGVEEEDDFVKNAEDDEEGDKNSKNYCSEGTQTCTTKIHVQKQVVRKGTSGEVLPEDMDANQQDKEGREEKEESYHIDDSQKEDSYTHDVAKTTDNVSSSNRAKDHISKINICDEDGGEKDDLEIEDQVGGDDSHEKDIDYEDSSEGAKTYIVERNVEIHEQKVGLKDCITVVEEHHYEEGRHENEEEEKDEDGQKTQVVGDDVRDKDDKDNNDKGYIDVNIQNVEDGPYVDVKSAEGAKTFAMKQNVILQKTTFTKVVSTANLEAEVIPTDTDEDQQGIYMFEYFLNVYMILVLI